MELNAELNADYLDQNVIIQKKDLVPDKIILNREFSLHHWCEILNCEEHDLLHAINTIGNSSAAVDDYLILNRRKK